MPSPLSPSISDAVADSLAAPFDVQTSTGAVADATQSKLYRVVWRWHFYAGLFTAPVMLVAALTGAIYTFHNELSGWMHPETTFVQTAEKRLTYDDQKQRLIAQAPEASDIDAVYAFNDSRRATQFIVHAFPGGHENPNQKHRAFSVNPYTGELLGSHIMEDEFFHVVLDVHRSMFAGVTGRLLVELATSWGLVLVLTGVYLWWPRGSRPQGVWFPRLKAKFYVVLRDLHSVSGAYMAVFGGIVLFTGLFVSLIWGGAFNAASARMNQSLMSFLMPGKAPAADGSGRQASLETLLATSFEFSQPGDSVYLSIAEQPETAHKVYLMHDGDTNTVRGLDLDPQSGTLISKTLTSELTPMVRVLALAVSLHQGKTFGTPSKIIAFVTCVVLVWLAISGVWMWWERRPRGSAGFPRKVVNARLPKWVWGLVVICGCILPTVGASILVILAGEWLIGRVRPRAVQA